ncbi:MAG: hypothetical protein KC449_15475, partial [Anaerolineales bacterium]|nr:hypothetical protein [Anaerolineales bacterium]
MIEDYYQTLLETIAASPLVRSSEVVLDKRTSQVGLVRGDLYFANDSRLHFRELVEFRVDAVTRHMYSFHYQDSEEIMVFRYDDTEHYPDLPNFPHHKHVGSSQEVVSAQPPEPSPSGPPEKSPTPKTSPTPK